MVFIRFISLAALFLGCFGRTPTIPFLPVTGSGGLQCPTAENLIFRDEKTWQEFWLENCKAIDESGKILPAPLIDFKKFTLVGVFLGERPTGGYGVIIKEIKKTKKELLVNYYECKPAPWSIVTMVITYPYALVAIEKTPLPVRFTRAGSK